MKTCKICVREFAAPHCLRAHYARYHPMEEQPKHLRKRRNVKVCNGNKTRVEDKLRIKDVHRNDTDRSVIANVRLTQNQLFQLVKKS